MTERFRTRAKARLPRWLLAVLVAFVGLGLVELYRVVIPLKSINPLWHEVTIGEPVISPWLYGGRDEEGYLRFYDQNQTIVLPPTAHTFDANGQFVVIEEFNSSSLVFAEPLAAIPAPWILTGGIVLTAGIWLLSRIIRRHTAFKPRKAPGMVFQRQSGFRRKPPNPSTRRRSNSRFRPSGRSRNG